MSINKEDVNKIISITQEYLPEEKTKEFLMRLDDEIGKKTTDKSLREILTTIRGIIDPKPTPVPFWFLWAFYLLVIAHMILVIGFAVAFVILPFYTEWYVALPLMTFMFFFVTTRNECQITNLENYMRQRMGMKRIGGFVGHYFMKPVRKLIKKIAPGKNQGLKTKH